MQVDVLIKKMEINIWFFNDSVNENKALLKKYVDVWDGTRW